MLKLDVPFLLDSDVSNGAENVTADGSRFSVSLDDPIKIPSDAKSCLVSVQESTIWNTVPNVLTGVNDKFYLVTPDNVAIQTVTIPQGLYALADLEEACKREYLAQVVGATATTWFNFIADNSTQKVVINLPVAGVQLFFDEENLGFCVNTFRDLLGIGPFTNVPPAGVSTGDYYQAGANVANFNTLEYFLIHSDLVTQGLRYNNAYNQIIGKVSITAPPGSQIVYEPRNPPRSPANHLIGSSKNVIRMWITDQNNNPVNTSGETWSCRLLIEYTL
jgi:hypothetical protein